MRVEMWKTGRIKPYGNNPRANDSAVRAVAKSIEEFGFRQPIVVDKEGVIVVGHTRWKAASKLGLKTVPVHVATDLTPTQARAYRIADNKTAELAEWDDSRLVTELEALVAEGGPDMKEFGFTEDVLAGLLGTDMGLTDPDEIPEPAKDPAVRRGEVWLLGRHRFMCGDSLSATDVARLTRGRMNLSITDPPFDMPAREQIRTLRLAGVRTVVIFGSGREFFRLANLDDLKYRFDFTIVYDRSVALAGKGSLMYRHNRILLADVEPEGNGPCSEDGMVLGAGVSFDRTRYASVSGTHCSVLQAPVQRRIYGYGKCCDLFRTFVRAMDGQTVYDPFAGSGTCLVACEIEGKKGVGMELEPRVAEIAIRRWEAFTGERAVRE